MKKIGIVSYNLHYNFSNYGSILQTYALQNSIRHFSDIEPVIIDYCPEKFRLSNPANQLSIIKDQSSDLYKACVLLEKDIQENEKKIRDFVDRNMNVTKKTYYPENFDRSYIDEGLSGYICGSDAIWSIEYFGSFDNAFFGNHLCMKNSYTISYAASFGETVFSKTTREQMLNRMKNFKMVGVRESLEIDTIRETVDVPVERVLDPTFLLSIDAYKKLMLPNSITKPYLLIYSRKYDSAMYETAQRIAEKYNLIIVEISLDIKDCQRHIIKYSACVEEFLSLIFNAEFVVTNSLHGTIFSIIMGKNFYVFPRLHGEKKILEMLELFGITERFMFSAIDKQGIKEVDYYSVNSILDAERDRSKAFLKKALDNINSWSDV